MIRTILFGALLLCSQIVQAQITVKQMTVIEVSDKSEKIAGFIAVPKDYQAKPFNIVHAKWETKVPKDRLRVKLTDISRQTIPFIDLKEDGLVVTQVGHFWLAVRGTYFDKTTQDIIEIDEEVDFFVDPLVPPPKPEPLPPPIPPKPSVPEDAFGNIGQRVETLAKALPSNQLVGKAYIDAAVSLSNTSATVNEVGTQLGTALTAIPNYDKYAEVSKLVNTDLASRWPLTKGILSDYYKCIASGLGVSPK